MIGYQPAKFQWCRLSASSFLEGFKKHNDDIIMSFHSLGFEICVSYETDIGYEPAKFNSLGYLDQILQRLVKDTKKHHYDVTS